MIYFLDKKKQNIVTRYRKSPIKLHSYFYPVHKNEHNLLDLIFYKPHIYNWNLMTQTLNDYFYTNDKTKFKAIKDSISFILNENFNFYLPEDNDIFVSKPLSSNGNIPIFQMCIGKKNKNDDISSIYKFKFYQRNNIVCITALDQTSIESYVFKNRGVDTFPSNIKKHFDNELKKTVNSLSKCIIRTKMPPPTPYRTITSTIEDLKAVDQNFSVKPLSIVQEYEQSDYLRPQESIKEYSHPFSLEPLKIVDDYDTYYDSTPQFVLKRTPPVLKRS